MKTPYMQHIDCISWCYSKNYYASNEENTLNLSQNYVKNSVEWNQNYETKRNKKQMSNQQNWNDQLAEKKQKRSHHQTSTKLKYGMCEKEIYNSAARSTKHRIFSSSSSSFCLNDWMILTTSRSYIFPNIYIDCLCRCVFNYSCICTISMRIVWCDAL